jgi:hypothetical protein
MPLIQSPTLLNRQVRLTDLLQDCLQSDLKQTTFKRTVTREALSEIKS